MATPFIIGVGAAGVALVARFGIKAFKSLKGAGGGAGKPKQFYPGGFDQQMNRKEARLILGLKENESPTPEVIRDAHKRLMKLNHPDLGGTAYIATKVNEAKEFLVKEREGTA
eukprot:EC713585.1.p1 GENE.EC713585.1~~EC713585.1.p1  ORF type:complete len:113 (+),score=16.69 EC713585.1:29-367(+)